MFTKENLNIRKYIFRGGNMFANFYNDNDCLFSVEVNSEKQAEDLADKLYTTNEKINDWTLTDKPMSKTIKI
jgi:hypothetical protein